MLIIAVYDGGGGILAGMDSQITQIFHNIIQPMLNYGGGGLIERSLKESLCCRVQCYIKSICDLS